MKKLIIIIMFLLLSSCATNIHSPMSGIDYKGSISEEGIGVVVKPPFWREACKLWDKLQSDKKKKSKSKRK